MKKIMIVTMLVLWLAVLVGCQNDAQNSLEGGKGVVWDQPEKDRIVMLLVEGSKATIVQAFENIPEYPVTVGDVYEMTYDADTSDDVIKPKEIKMVTTAAENKEVYVMDINSGEAIKKDYPDIYLVDVRTEEEYNQGHLKDALLLPVDQVSARAAQDLPNRKTPVLVYCRSGNRSAQAAALLKEQGYNLVIDIGGVKNYQGTLIK